MPKVFINYRTDDGDFAAALLDMQLSAVFGEENIFLASRTIEPGQDFEHEILTQLRECTVVIAVIGTRWLQATDQDGRRRLDLEEDWVRRELVEATTCRIPIIPVLLDHTRRLDHEQLPSPLRILANAQYRYLRHRHVRDDVPRIIKDLRELDRRLVPIPEASLRSYLRALLNSLQRTQGWMPYATLDRGFLHRSVSVSDEPPNQPVDESLYYHPHLLHHGDVSWERAIKDVPIAVILGDAGYGKTWLLRYHGLELCDAALKALDRGIEPVKITVPLYVHAHQLASNWNAGLAAREALVKSAMMMVRDDVIEPETLLRFFVQRIESAASSLYILIDAYDEVFDDQLLDCLKEALAWLSGLVRAGGGPRILLTSRPAGYEDPFTHYSENDRVDGRTPLLPQYLHLGVLGEHQVRRLWNRWFVLRGKPVPEDRLNPVMAPESAIRMFAGVPLVAAFCAWVAENESVAANRSGLYGQVVDKFLGLHWKISVEAGSVQQDPAFRAQLSHALTELAWHMAAGQSTWQDVVTVTDCESILAPALTIAGSRQERSRTFDAVRKFGILLELGVPDTADQVPVAWIHRSVHQFLAARKLITMSQSNVHTLIDDRCWFRTEWADVLDFAIGLEAQPPRGKRPVTTVVRQLALSNNDGLGWFATIFAAAGAGIPAEDDLRRNVVDRVWALHRVGFLSATHLARVLALTPEADPAEIVAIVLDAIQQHRPSQETWDALACSAQPGVTALQTAITHSADASGAAIALYKVAPDTAVEAIRERLKAGLVVDAVDSPVLRDLNEDDVSWLRQIYRSDRNSEPIARTLGWTGHKDARRDLLTVLEDTETTPAARRAAVSGLAASYGNELDEEGCNALLGIALRDPDRTVRMQTRDELKKIGRNVPWVSMQIDEHFDELHRDQSMSELSDLESIAARLHTIGPATITAVVMLQEDPKLCRGPVSEAMLALTAKALDGELNADLIMQVATFVGPKFIELACERLHHANEFPAERIVRLATGLCLAAPRDLKVFEAIVAAAAVQPHPTLTTALHVNDLPPIDKITYLVQKLKVLPQLNRAAIRIWSDVLYNSLLEVPSAERTALRQPCSAATQHILTLLERVAPRYGGNLPSKRVMARQLAGEEGALSHAGGVWRRWPVAWIKRMLSAHH